MAIENDLPPVQPLSLFFTSSSSSTSSCSPPFLRQQRLVQVATSNSATFIRFPTSTRQSTPFVPVSHPRTNRSIERLSPSTVDTQSLSNQSKTSVKAPATSTESNDHKPVIVEQRVNPILNNPLLNHRKEPPKHPTTKSSYEQTLKKHQYLSSKPFKPTSNTIQPATIRASTVHPIVHQQEINVNLSDRLIVPIDKSKAPTRPMPYINNHKLDYITRWLNEVRAAAFTNEIFQLEFKQPIKRPTIST